MLVHTKTPLQGMHVRVVVHPLATSEFSTTLLDPCSCIDDCPYMAYITTFSRNLVEIVGKLSNKVAANMYYQKELTLQIHVYSQCLHEK